VGQPLKVPVSYWNQSTASITGMIGTSLTMTSWILFRMLCCSDALVVVSYWSSRASVLGLLYRS
jgi:hypothetical protein